MNTRAQLQWVVGNTFEVCIINADGTSLVQLADNALFEGKGTRDTSAGIGDACVTKLTTEGISLLPQLGQLRVHVRQ